MWTGIPLIIDRNRLMSIHFRLEARLQTDFQAPTMIVCQRTAVGVLKTGDFLPETSEPSIVSMTASKRTCPLCKTRKVKRYCPAKQTHICPVCCGQKREVEIDCPADCVYLHSGRKYERSKKSKNQAEGQVTQRLWSRDFQARNMELLTGLWTTIHESRSQSPDLVDADVREVLERLLKTYQTLEGGIYYDHVPDTLTQKVLYGSLKSLLDLSASTPKTGDILDCLKMSLEMENLSDSSRPKSREFLGRLSDMVSRSTEEPSHLESPPKIVLP